MHLQSLVRSSCAAAALCCVPGNAACLVKQTTLLFVLQRQSSAMCTKTEVHRQLCRASLSPCTKPGRSNGDIGQG